MDKNKHIAINGAELLGMEWAYELNYICVKVGKRYSRFDPANNGTDMNKLIEALNINVYKFGDNNWVASTAMNESGYTDIEATSKYRDEAIRECVIKALGIGVDND